MLNKWIAVVNTCPEEFEMNELFNIKITMVKRLFSGTFTIEILFRFDEIQRPCTN